MTEGIEMLSFNVCVSRFMITLNEWQNQQAAHRDLLRPFLILLAPFAPHIASELWERLEFDGELEKAQWPVYDAKYLVETTFECPISFNGKMRFTLTLPRDLSTEDIEKRVLEAPETQRYLEGKTLRKVVVVPNKIVNIVLS